MCGDFNVVSTREVEIVSRKYIASCKPKLEAECVVELGAQSLAERREARVELIPSEILPVLCVDEVEVVSGRDDPSRLEKEPDDLRDVVVLNVAGD